MRKLLLFVLLLSVASFGNAQVISQVYGGGGNASATYTNDFIEIFNNTASPINLTNYSVQYAAANTTSGTFTVVTTLSGTIEPGQYYLVQASSGGAVGAPLPTPDASGSTNLAAGDGKVILVNSTTPVPIGSTGCPTPATGVTVLDFVGYGSANCAEGTAETGAANPNINTKSIVRAANGCSDTNDNQTDFSVNTFGSTGSVTPRNTASARTSCPQASPLPVKFDNVRLTKKASGIELTFSNLTESNVIKYAIERSADGQQFTTVREIAPMKNDGGKADYNYLDAQPLSGINYYRIKVSEQSGKTAYSAPVKLNIGLVQAGLIIFPNPVKGSQLSYQANNLQAGTYKLVVRNAVGQVITTQQVRHEGGNISQTLPLQTSKSGVYYLELNGAEQIRKSFIIQ